MAGVWRPGRLLRPTDPDFEEILSKELLNSDAEDSESENVRDEDWILSDHNSESEQSEASNIEEEREYDGDQGPSSSGVQSSEKERNSDADSSQNNPNNTPITSSRYFRGKNRYKWSKENPPSNVRTRAHNIVIHLPFTK